MRAAQEGCPAVCADRPPVKLVWREAAVLEIIGAEILQP